jgi:hypothetical protein
MPSHQPELIAPLRSPTSDGAHAVEIDGEIVAVPPLARAVDGLPVECHNVTLPPIFVSAFAMLIMWHADR